MPRFHQPAGAGQADPPTRNCRIRTETTARPNNPPPRRLYIRGSGFSEQQEAMTSSSIGGAVSIRVFVGGREAKYIENESSSSLVRPFPYFHERLELPAENQSAQRPFRGTKMSDAQQPSGGAFGTRGGS